MKRTTFLAAAILAVIASQARTLSPEEALARVNADASAPLRAKAASAAESLKLASTTSTTSGAPAVYLFENASSGFMLVAADDVAQPLLGYSDAPAQGEIPPQMQQWLQAYAAEIEAVQAAENSGITTLQIPGASPASRPQRRAIAPLLTTRWDQIAPYNNDCPMQGSKRTYTGCVATAIAQIMKYFNYPAHGTGTGTATVGSTEYTMDLGVDFQWDLMLDSYTGSSYTNDQAAAVATLMKACGFATEMQYSSSASGTPSSKVVPALTGNFGYDPGARLYYRDYYGLMEWENMVYDNLANVGPVYYDGSATGGGHAFVCDGYSADGFFHFNWGWSGMYNGYFLLTALNPSGQGIGGYAGGYNTSQSAVLGIRRPTGTAAPAPDPQLSLDLGDQPLAATLSGNTLTLSTEYKSGGWWNLSGAPFSGQIGCRFTNVASPSDVRYAVLGNTGTIAERTGYQSIPVSLTSVTLTPGATYSVEVVTRSGSSGQWFAARVPVGRIGYALVTRSAAGSYSVSVPADESFTWEDGSIDSEIYHKQPAKITVTLANNTDTELMRMVAPILFTLSGNTPTLKALADGELFDLESGQSETREMVFTFDKFYNNMQLNTRVYVGLLDLQTSQILGQFNDQITFTSAPAAGTLSASSFTIEGGALVKDPSAIWFDTSVRLSSGYLAAPLYVVVTDDPYNGGDVLATAASETLFMNGGNSYSARVCLDMSGAAPGNYYALLCQLNSSSMFNPITSSVISFTISPEAGGVEEIGADSEASLPVEYFTLQGIRVLHPEKGGIYIRRQGSSVTKIRF